MARDSGLPFYRGTCEVEDRKEQAWHRHNFSSWLAVAAKLTVEEA
jgi:hypothetical protein